MKRCLILAAVLALAACNKDSMTRDFGVSRDAGPTTAAGGLPPLSEPPGLMSRPDMTPLLPQLQPKPPQQQQAAAAPPSGGQAALLQAAGGPESADVRQQLDNNAGVVSLGPGFAEQIMNWTPPPGHVPLGAPAQKGWFSRLF
jgi:hypothetical protein